MSKKISVTVEKDSDGYLVATVPDLQGCHTQAKSLDELMERIREAITLCLDDDSACELVLDAEISFAVTTLEEVAGSLVHDGVTKQIADFDAAIDAAMRTGSL